MSDFLFPHGRGSRALRIRLTALAAASALALAGVAAYLGLSFLGVVTGDVRAEARLTTTGDSLGINSDVKFRGLRVGRVLTVEHGVEPSARIVVQQRYVDQIPADVVARVLPGTLFGNEYVELVRPDRQAAAVASLTDGAVIAADTSTRTLRLMDTFAATQRLLGAMDPARLQAAIAQLARALEGRGDDVATFVRDADAFLATWAENEPLFYEDLDLLATNVETLADVSPQLLGALRDTLPLAGLVTETEPQTTALLVDSTRLARSVGTFLDEHTERIAQLLDHSAAVLGAFAARTDSFELLLRKLPPVLENGATAVRNRRIQMEGVIGTQTPHPYTAADCPRYGDLPGRNCGGS